MSSELDGKKQELEVEHEERKGASERVYPRVVCEYHALMGSEYPFAQSQFLVPLTCVFNLV